MYSLDRKMKTKIIIYTYMRSGINITFKHKYKNGYYNILSIIILKNPIVLLPKNDFTIHIHDPLYLM